jgi:transcriptional regulator with XRE-family HTH domain
MSIDPYAIIPHHEAMLAAIRRRRDEIGITNELLEEISGIQVGYASKILAEPPAKRLQVFTLFLLADALSLTPAFLENPEMAAKMASRYTKRKLRKVIPSQLRTYTRTPDQLRFWGRHGGFARARNLSPAELSKIGRRANQVRWSRVRSSEAAIV